MNLLTILLIILVTGVAIFFLIKGQLENNSKNIDNIFSLGEDKEEELPWLPLAEEVKEKAPEKVEEVQVEVEASKPISNKKPRPNKRKAK